MKTIIFNVRAYAIMYEEIFGTPIDQIVILQAGEDGSASIRKEQSDYEEKLGKAIEGFYKYYEEKTKGIKS